MGFRKFKQRNNRRVWLTTPLRIFERNTDRCLGKLLNIHENGMLLLSEIAFRRNSRFRLSLLLAGESGFRQVFLEAQSIWCRKGLHPDFYHIGFRFTDLPDQTRDLLREKFTP